jgi:hypothetical protein
MNNGNVYNYLIKNVDTGKWVKSLVGELLTYTNDIEKAQQFHGRLMSNNICKELRNATGNIHAATSVSEAMRLHRLSNPVK